ncbi:13248_t:CDS:2, partial [Entrophospora sp. SA101]
DFSNITGRKGSISSGVGSGQALGYNSYNDNEERASRNIHNNNVNNSIKKPHSRDSSSRLSIKRNRRDKSSSDSLSLHMSTPEMARASFGLGNNSLSSVSSISTSNRRSDGSDDGDTNNLPSSSSSKQVSNTITIPDNDDDTKDLQIQDAESTMLEFHTSTSTFLEFHTSTSTFLEFHTSTSSFNDNNDMKDTDNSNVNLVRTETFGMIDWLKRIITEKRESYEFNDIIKELIDLIPKSSSPKKFSFGNYRSPSKFPLRDIDPKSVGRWDEEGWEKCIKDYEYEIINRCSTDVLVSRKMYQGAHVARRSQYDILFRNWSLKIVGVCSNTYNVIFG